MSGTHSNSSFDRADLGKIKVRWEAGDRAEDIASDFKVHPNTIRYQAKANGWERGILRGMHVEGPLRRQKSLLVMQIESEQWFCPFRPVY